MAKINLTPEDKATLIEAINKGVAPSPITRNVWSTIPKTPWS